MSASMMGLGMADASGRSYGSPSYTGISPTSSTSSQSRYYQPAVPSPLHAQQRVGPIHIPRDMSAPSASSHLHRRQLSSQESHTNVHSSPPQNTNTLGIASSPERAAYSSYPSDPHHKELKRLPSRTTTSRSPGDQTSTSPRSREMHSPKLSSAAHSPPPASSKSMMLERLASSASPPRHLPRHILRTSSGGTSPNIGPRSDLLQHDSYSSLNEGGETSQRNRPENSGHGGRSGSLLDDDDSLVFKMSELGNESGGPFDSGMYNYQQSSLYGSKERPRLLIGPNSHFASPSPAAASGGEVMSRRASSGSGTAMATVMEQEEPNTASSNSSSSEAIRGGPDAHMFSGDW